MASEAAGIPLVAGHGLREADVGAKGSLDWKVDHRYYWRMFGVDWPMPIGWQDSKSPCPNEEVRYCGQREREQEVVWLLCFAFPFPPAPIGHDPEESRYQFIDVNPTIVRILAGCIEEVFDTESGAITGVRVKKSPWSDCLQTQVGSGKLIVRTCLPNGRIVTRCLEALEAMAFMGWDRSWFRDPATVHDKPLHVCKSDIHYAELVSNMGGNAMSLFHYAPIRLATMATIGHFYNTDATVSDESGSPAGNAAVESLSSSSSSDTD